MTANVLFFELQGRDDVEYFRRNTMYFSRCLPSPAHLLHGLVEYSQMHLKYIINEISHTKDRVSLFGGGGS